MISVKDLPNSKLKGKERFAFHCIVMEIPGMVQEYKFHPTRRWRFDYYHPESRRAYEYEGIAGHGRMRHTTLTGYTKDCEKYNEAGKSGITVFRFTVLNFSEVKNYLPKVLF